MGILGATFGFCIKNHGESNLAVKYLFDSYIIYDTEFKIIDTNIDDQNNPIYSLDNFDYKNVDIDIDNESADNESADVSDDCFVVGKLFDNIVMDTMSTHIPSLDIDKTKNIVCYLIHNTMLDDNIAHLINDPNIKIGFQYCNLMIYICKYNNETSSEHDSNIANKIDIDTIGKFYTYLFFLKEKNRITKNKKIRIAFNCCS